MEGGFFMVQVYNYMLESYPLRKDTKYPVSKRSELKKVYNDIVNLSKCSPFYKINLSKENQAYTIGVKESALALKSRINDMADEERSGFTSKAVTVSDESVLSAQLLSDNTEGLPDQIELQVNSLATVQINRGKELLNSSRGLPSGEYQIRARIGDESFSLNFVHEQRQENYDVLKKMVDFLNQNLTGINAVVDQGSTRDYSRLNIISDMSGRFGDKRFSFEDMDIYDVGVTDYFGMNRMDRAPSLAKFELNGSDKQTATNAFTLENTLRITLNNTSDKPVTVKIVQDSRKILSAVDSVLNAYNDLIRLAKDRTLSNTEHYKAGKLISEMKGLEGVYQEELEACGLKASEDGILSLEEPLASQAAEDGGMESLFTRENGFITRLLDKADTIAINPMEYLDKTIVTYPNKEKDTYCNPYVTSMYSGLFFNSYC
jgi:flagellar hook-associated protein 2